VGSYTLFWNYISRRSDNWKNIERRNQVQIK